MRILVTGFQPFGGESVNPSWEAAERLNDRPEGIELIKRRLPVSFEEAPLQIMSLMDEYSPDAVISIGQAGGRSALTVERIAVNFGSESGREDALSGFALVENAPDAYFSTLPISEIVTAVRGAGVPCGVSATAGSYICNSVMYNALHHAAQCGRSTRCGFVHVPYLPGQTVEKHPSPASMSVYDIVRGLTEVLKAVAAAEARQR